MKNDLVSLQPNKLNKLDQKMDFLEGPGHGDFHFWAEGKITGEAGFCDQLLKWHPMKCIRGILYDINGRADMQKLDNELYNEVKLYTIYSVASSELQ